MVAQVFDPIGYLSPAFLLLGREVRQFRRLVLESTVDFSEGLKLQGFHLLDLGFLRFREIIWLLHPFDKA